MPRIIAGEKKGLKLEAPRGEATRPTGDRVKEAIFSILQAELRGVNFLDLFGGSGQMGLEAASRGAARVWIVEKDHHAAGIIRKNIEKAGFDKSVSLIQAPVGVALSRLHEAGESMDFIYFDPPWREECRFFSQLRDPLLRIMKEHSRLLLETDEAAEKELIALSEPALNLLRTCHYGRAMVLFYGKYGEKEAFSSSLRNEEKSCFA